MRFDRWINEGPITLGMHLLLQILSSKPIAPDRLHCNENFNLVGTIPDQWPICIEQNSDKVRFKCMDGDNIPTAFVLCPHILISIRYPGERDFEKLCLICQY